jgi:hypothetical protein
MSRRSQQMKFRVRGGLGDKLRDAAALSGHSISEEIERRLEQSFQAADIASVVRDAVREELLKIELYPAYYDNASLEWNTPEQAMQTFRSFFVCADTEQSRMDYSNQ